MCTQKCCYYDYFELELSRFSDILENLMVLVASLCVLGSKARHRTGLAEARTRCWNNETCARETLSRGPEWCAGDVADLK